MPRGSWTQWIVTDLLNMLHFGDAEKLRDLFHRFSPRKMAEDVAALEFAINAKRGPLS